jgi:hypothetical protein
MILGLNNFEVIFLAVLVGGFFIVGITFVAVWMHRRAWPKIAVLAEERPPYGIKIIGRERCRLVTLTDTGEEIYLLKNSKKYRVFHGHYLDANGKQIGWCKSARDGYYYNFKLGSIDKKLMEMGVIPTSRTARLEQSAMRDIVKNKFKREGFMEKWGTTIQMGLVILTIIIMFGGFWFILDKNAESSSTNKATAEANLQVTTKLDNILSRIDNVPQGTGASGLIPANQSG